jgi:hypothetical protein
MADGTPSAKSALNVRNGTDARSSHFSLLIPMPLQFRAV